MVIRAFVRMKQDSPHKELKTGSDTQKTLNTQELLLFEQELGGKKNLPHLNKVSHKTNIFTDISKSKNVPVGGKIGP